MPKKLVVCCDGTWNTAADGTNVRRIFEIVRDQLGAGRPPEIDHETEIVRGIGADGEAVVAFYDTGVGTGRLFRLLGGVTGIGLSSNIEQAYTFLCHNYEPGDTIYGFGFSRGAFTVRSLTGLIGTAGILRDPTPANVRTAFAYYRREPGRRSTAPEKESLLKLRRHASVPIRFLGVFDTVGSLGVPATPLQLVSGLFERVIRFHDTQLGTAVMTACHALAIDEHRGNFKPAVWSDAARSGQEVLQVWFNGAHSDVGGGYRSRGLADISLDWMLGRAIERGLPLRAVDYRQGLRMSCHGPRHNSTAGIWKLLEGSGVGLLSEMLGAVPVIGGAMRVAGSLLGSVAIKPYERPIGGEQLADDGSLAVPVGAKLHDSVPARYGKRLPPTIRAALDSGMPVFRERTEPREASEGRVEVRVDRLPSQLLDRSVSGIRVETGSALAVGSECRVEWPAEARECTARVVWSAAGRAGLLLSRPSRAIEPTVPPTAIAA